MLLHFDKVHLQTNMMMMMMMISLPPNSTYKVSTSDLLYCLIHLLTIITERPSQPPN